MDGKVTRRLPSWMLAPPANQSSKCKSSVKRNNNEQSKEAVASKPWETEAKDLTVELLPENVNCSPPRKHERKRGKRKLSQQDEGSGGKVLRVLADRKESKIARKVQEADPRRRQRKESSPPAEVNKESEITCNDNFDDGDDDDVDLTVEDLVSIAKEYIAADVERKKPKHTSRESQSGPEFPATSNTADVLEASTSALAGDRESLAEPKSTFQSSTECLTCESEKIVLPASGLEDPVQDMLNLFFGNLLDKNVCEDRKDGSVSNGTVFSQEVKPSQPSTNTFGEAVATVKKRVV